MGQGRGLICPSLWPTLAFSPPRSFRTAFHFWLSAGRHRTRSLPPLTKAVPHLGRRSLWTSPLSSISLNRPSFFLTPSGPTSMVQMVNVTLDDYSPVIDYSPRWVDGSTADPYWKSYTNNGTYTLTATYGASASLTFNGTAIWIYGARRSTHGQYNISLDGQLSYYDDGYSGSPLFQQVLFAAVGLDGTKPHTVSIINAYTDPVAPYLDVDSIVYQMGIPAGYQEVKQQDDASNFRYSASGWSTNPENLASYDGGTGHSTSLGDAYVDYTFQGSHVELYGAVGPFGGLFTVQIDDGPLETLNATRSKFTPQIVLYQGSGLGPRNHTMRVTNAPFSGQTLSIDYAIVGQPSTGSDPPSLTPAPTPSPKFGGGVIGGIAAGSAGLLLVTMALLLLWCRRRHIKSAVRPRDVLDAEFANEGNGYAGDSSTRLTPWLNSTVPGYRAAPAPKPRFPPSAGYDLRGRDDAALYRGSYLEEPATPFTAQPQFGVHNADGGGGGSRPLPNAAEEKRRFGAAIRERDRQAEEGRAQGIGLEALVPLRGTDGVVLPPDYDQVTHPST
ncbi:hypothetical protein BJ322DRAFT_1035054 [Thelephora terrestris]|uniref:Uncharacterized protein n=1 Tax=Thelephora terrestris TaxID=56493 RepID=A0A9P6LDP3_9AGAM|nr:hypothetical protein BJ322DRAFT_1035054 [Thelephora terrestris]